MTIKAKGTKKKPSNTEKAQEDALSSSCADGSGKSTVASINNEAVQQAMDLSGFRENCCHHCGVSNEDIGGFLLQCAACKKAYYCGMACFNAAIDVHMQFCMTSKLDKEPEGRKEAAAVPQKKEEPKAAKKASTAPVGETKRKSKSKSSAKTAPKKRTSKSANVKKAFIDPACSDSEDCETESEPESTEQQTNRRRGGRRSKNPSTVSPHIDQTEAVAEADGEQKSSTTLVVKKSEDTVKGSTPSSEHSEESNHLEKDAVDLTLELGSHTDATSTPEIVDNEKEVDADVTSGIEAIEPSLQDAEPNLLESDASDMPLEGDAKMSNETLEEETEDEETRRTRRGGGLVAQSGRAQETSVNKVASSNNDEDEDVESSRCRRGGGLVNSNRQEDAQSTATSKVLRRAQSSKSNVEWSKPDWTEDQLQAWRSAATEMQQQESTSSFDGTVEAAVVEMDAAAVSTETTNVTSNHSDEDMEETRRRRGGGLVAQQNGRAGNDATIKRSSSLTLRSSNHANSQGDKPEWTDNELLAWKMAAEEAKQEAQDKAATGDEDGPTLGSNSAEAMARSNEAHASDSECSDEDVEETRRRRGGGVVTGRRVADPNMIRSSSLTLRSFTEKETNQAEVPDWTLSQLQAWRAAASEINSEFQSESEIPASDDDEFEETRQRRGGGAIHGRSVMVGEMKRSSSMVLRNTTICKQQIEKEKPEWAESHLRATEHGEAIKSNGSVVPVASVSRRSATPEWISKRNLRSTSNRDLSRQESERSIGVLTQGNSNGDGLNGSWSSAAPEWVSQRSWRSTGRRDLSRQESERSIGVPTSRDHKGDNPHGSWNSATAEWVGQRNLRPTSNRGLSRQESERSIGVPTKGSTNKGDNHNASWTSATTEWVSQRSLRSTSNRDLLCHESERNVNVPSTCECKLDIPKPVDGIVTPSMRRSMLRKCQSCRLQGEPTVVPDIVRRAQHLRNEKSATNTSIAE